MELDRSRETARPINHGVLAEEVDGVPEELRGAVEEPVGGRAAAVAGRRGHAGQEPPPPLPHGPRPRQAIPGRDPAPQDPGSTTLLLIHPGYDILRSN